LRTLGFDNIQSVRVGKYIEIRVDIADRTKAEEQVHEMCDRLLANPVIEDFRFELAEIKS